MRFKILQMDAGGEAVLGWAKQASSRLVAAGNRSFSKTWTVEGITIRARCVEFMGDILVKLWITVSSAKKNVITNRLARAYSWRTPINFKLVTPLPAARAAWYDTVTPVMLPALAPSTTFTIDPITNVPLPPTGLVKASAMVEAFRKHVAAGHQAGIRNWFGILQRYLVLRYNQIDFATRDDEMLVSKPDGNGRFYLLWGFWASVIGEPFDPLAPGNDHFTGLIVSSTDLSLQAAQSLNNVVDFDKPVTTPGYIGPQRLGDGFQVYRRTQLGLFPNNATDLVPPFRYRYRPDQLRPDFGNSIGSPYAIAYFDRKGVSTGERAETWTYTFERHRLSSNGAIVVENIPLPTLASSTMAVSVGTTFLDRAASFSGFSTDVVFFDGQDFVKVGSHQVTHSQQVRVGGVVTSDVEGTAAVAAAFESTSQAFHGSDAPKIPFDSFIPDLGVALVSNLTVGSEYVVANLATRGAAFSDSEIRSVIANSTFIEDFARLPLWLAGPSWGAYQHVKSDGAGGQAGLFNEAGFTCAGPFGFSAPPRTSGDPPTLASVQTMSLYRPNRGVFWLRPDGTMGVFLYRLVGDITADATKYRNVLFGLNGFIKTQPGWEDPTIILARLMTQVRVDVNNFATPAMVPWLADEPDLVIVEA